MKIDERRIFAPKTDSNSPKKSFKVKLIKIPRSKWWDTESLGEAIMEKLESKGIKPKHLLFRGISKEDKDVFLTHGTDHPPYETVAALHSLCDPEDREGAAQGAVEYALNHNNPMVAVYKNLEKANVPRSFVYKLDLNHPTKGLLALIEIE